MKKCQETTRFVKTPVKAGVQTNFKFTFLVIMKTSLFIVTCQTNQMELWKAGLVCKTISVILLFIEKLD